MMNVRNPWKNSWTIRLVAVIDIAFAGLLVSIYLHKLLSPRYHENVSNEVTRVPSLKLFLLGPIIFNSFQIIMSFNLFSAARRGSEYVISYAKAHTWFQFSTVMLVFLMIKLFMVLWFPPHGSLSRRDIFGATLIVLESVFKIFGLFVVREFIDDLQTVLGLFPVQHLYYVYATPVPVPMSSPAANNSTNSDNEPASNSLHPTHTRLPPAPPTNAGLDTSPPPPQNRNSTIFAVV